jgi:hypothetical protein
LLVCLCPWSALVAQAPPAPGYAQELAEWRAAREARLRSEDGWLAVVGLHWLQDGGNTFGSGGENAIRLPAGAPVWAGALQRRGDGVRYVLAPGVTALLDDGPAAEEGPLRSDSEGTPSTLRFGSVSFHLIQRGDRLGVRVRDRQSAALKAFRGTGWYEGSEAWRVQARFVAHRPPRTLPVTNVLGQVQPMANPGYAELTVAGRQVRLEALLEAPDADQLFFIFRDQTSGRATYGAGRFLYAPLPQDGSVRLDFNKAYSPPCAFTRFATCPLPPEANRLDVAIEAGERFLGIH